MDRYLIDRSKGNPHNQYVTKYPYNMNIPFLKGIDGNYFKILSLINSTGEDSTSYEFEIHFARGNRLVEKNIKFTFSTGLYEGFVNRASIISDTNTKDIFAIVSTNVDLTFNVDLYVFADAYREIRVSTLYEEPLLISGDVECTVYDRTLCDTVAPVGTKIYPITKNKPYVEKIAFNDYPDNSNYVKLFTIDLSTLNFNESGANQSLIFEILNTVSDNSTVGLISSSVAPKYYKAIVYTNLKGRGYYLKTLQNDNMSEEDIFGMLEAGNILNIYHRSDRNRVVSMELSHQAGFTLLINPTMETINGAEPTGTKVAFKALGYSGSVTYDPPSLTTGTETSTTVTIDGVALGDFASASFSLSTQGIKINADVTATDIVTVTFRNDTGGTINLSSGTLKVKVVK